MKKLKIIRQPKYKKKRDWNRVSVLTALTSQYFLASVKVEEPPLYMKHISSSLIHSGGQDTKKKIGELKTDEQFCILRYDK